MTRDSLSSETFLSVSTPGRICLFGEHQDYLGLPVIASAISLRVQISGTYLSDPIAHLRMPDIGQKDSVPLDQELPYRSQRDYLRSSVNVLRRNGYTFSQGFDAGIRGEIPINSGTSSSSALVVTWLHLLTRMSDQAATLSGPELALLAHMAEVTEFDEPGGMMDHYSTAIGGVIYLETGVDARIEELHPQLGSFILGDSGEPKETKGILARVKRGVLGIAAKIRSIDPDASLKSLESDDLPRFSQLLSTDEMALLAATVSNRIITRRALDLLRQKDVDHAALGDLLNQHQSFLRDPLRISTPKIDAMIQAAADAGALGAKINGSGGGGCMFAYAPNDPEKVLESLRPFGRAWKVDVDEGTRVEPSDRSHA